MMTPRVWVRLAVCALIPGTYAAAADAATEQTELISVKTPAGATATPSGLSFVSTPHTMSRTGRYIVFSSYASDVIPNQDNRSATRIFVRDRQTGVTTQVTASPSTVYIDSPSISDDGRYVAFNGYGDVLGNGESAFTPRVYVIDLQTHAIEKVTVGLGNTLPNGNSSQPMISGNGRYVVFTSEASNLVANDTNGTTDVFETDRSTHTTKRVSLNTSGKQLNNYSQSPYVSTDGRYVAFETSSSNATTLAGYVPSAVLLYDRSTGVVEFVNRNTKGTPSNVGGYAASVSDDGRYVAFYSQATNLVPGAIYYWGQVYVRDRVAHTLACASISSAGAIGNYNSLAPVINSAGTAVVFASTSSNLAPNDPGTNAGHVFVHSLTTGATTRASIANDGTPAWIQGLDVTSLSITGDGSWVAFNTAAPNLVPDDQNNALDVFAHQVLPRTIIRVNAGGSSYVDSLGRSWLSDRGFNTGVVSKYTAAITGTSDPALYQDQRYDAVGGAELHYQFAVPNGTYLVRLHFAENYVPNFHAGARVFDVDVEGVRRYSGLDIYAQVGGHAALVLETNATVINGSLTIDFHHEVENPLINAIEVIQQ